MKLAKIIAWIGLLAMSVVLAYGFTVGNFVEDGKLIPFRAISSATGYPL